MLGCWTYAGVWAQSQQFTIEYLTIDNGLPQNEVTALLQDQRGFLWVGTRGGLARYDGYTFRVFQYEPGNAQSLYNNSIETLYEDHLGMIWIGTKSGGLNCFDPITEHFSVYQFEPTDSTSLSGNRVVSIAEDAHHRLWVGTWGNGLNCLDRATGRFTRFLPGTKVLALQYDAIGQTLWVSANNLYRLAADEDAPHYMRLPYDYFDITDIVVDATTHHLWLCGWEQGLVLYDAQTETVVTNPVQVGMPAFKTPHNVYSLLQDHAHRLWVGSWGEGLEVVPPASSGQPPRHLALAPLDERLYSTDYHIILSMLQDRQQNIWIGTDGGGLCKVSFKKNYFSAITRQNSKLSSNHVLSILEDHAGSVWIGTKGGGLNEWRHHTVIHHREIFQAIPHFDINVVHALHQDAAGTVWFGTDYGLHKITGRQGTALQFATYTPVPQQGNAVTRVKVTAILEDHRHQLWVGTQQNGLKKITGWDAQGQPVYDTYRANPRHPHTLNDDRISVLFQDSHQRLWVGTYKGLHLYDESMNGFFEIHHVPGDPSSLSNDIVNCITEDACGNIWVGTSGGLNRIYFEGHQLRAAYQTRQNGLPSDYINALLPDGETLWASTNGGLFQLNPQTGTLLVYGMSDGLPSHAFSEGAAGRSRHGQMYFGGPRGITTFQPDAVRHNTEPFPLVFTSLRVMNHEVMPGDSVNGHVVLHTAITEQPTLSLSYLDKVFSLTVASLDYAYAEKQQYAYQLVGFDDQWTYSGHDRTITYTNLKPGRYQLLIKAGHGVGHWQAQMLSLTIQVLPPPWLTGWACTLYVVGLLAFGFTIYHVATKQRHLQERARLANQRRQHALLERRKDQEVNEVKFRFFTNVSHELRTPLTLIVSPLEEMLARPDVPPVMRDKLLLMHRHTLRLVSLVNQLLELRKAETGAVQLHRSPEDMVTFASNVFASFADYAARKKLDYVFEHAVQQPVVCFDPQKMEMVLANLLSNAIKFTPAGGAVTCILSERVDPARGRQMVITITDTGAGLAAEEVEKIFDLYYQVGTTHSANLMGTGIGLSLVKEMVTLHEGVVHVESAPGHGSVFTVTLPAEENTNALEASPSIPAASVGAYEPSEQWAWEEPLEANGEGMEKPLLLVVEDNEELRLYLHDLLLPMYDVILANQGEEGLLLAQYRVPDLIISDVMMPGMDGYALSRQLKMDERTSHIPLILLTARTMPQYELEGLETGADDYIKKPFHMGVLQARIHRLLVSRRRLQAYYSRKVTLQPTEVEITPQDEQFLQKAITLVEDNLLNQALNTQFLASGLYMSDSTLYRKLKALTGQTIQDFIRSIRLKRAAQLLEAHVSVTEAAYQTGFSDPKYFRTCFKKQFGCTPSAYSRSPRISTQ